MIKIGIYKITNLCNNKCYIGQSRNINKRWAGHKAAAYDKTNKGYHYPLYKAFRKYGLNNFQFEIIEECLIKDLDEKEIYWIDTLKPEYNQTTGGEGHKKIAIVKLSYEDVRIIREMLKSTNIKIKDIAVKFNVHRDTIRDINVGRTWREDNIIYPIRISKTDSTRHKKEKNFCIDCGIEISKGSVRCLKCNNKRYKVPLEDMLVTREELKNLIRTTSFIQIGKQFNVSDNAIRKWCDKFNLPRKKAEIKSYSDEEWELI